MICQKGTKETTKNNEWINEIINCRMNWKGESTMKPPRPQKKQIEKKRRKSENRRGRRKKGKRR